MCDQLSVFSRFLSTSFFLSLSTLCFLESVYIYIGSVETGLIRNRREKYNLVGTE